MKAFLNALKEVLKDFPTTVAVTLTGCAMALYSMVMYWVAVWREWRMEELTLGLWLGFVAATMGISFAWFRHKRNTYEPPTPAGKDQEDTPSLPALPAAPIDQGEK